ncbi:hypothetical protein KUTeg_005178 [Tegillarca granosa]|uniref:FYVE-type domain-containing protein n=1 Tax=Tegillarca granosa TaxID=220873 RepID=A0ABQ9FJ09_TEGGR|nr:hypothetical protein KUTeg_005178 [Tegillarca granosa]
MWKTDSSPLAQFYFADEELNLVAAELDSFDGRKDPERCTALVNRLRSCQDKVLNVIQAIMEEAIPGQRANRDFRVKFPDDVLQENLAGQLWFGAECLAAGSSIMNREIESASMRPLARALTKNLDSLRTLLREQCLRNINSFTERIKESLMIFDKLFAEFELRALTTGLLNQDLIDDCDPALMFTIPRLAIISCACDKSEREHGTVSSDIAEASCSHGNSSNSATGLTHDIVNQKRSSKVDKQLQTAQKVPFERIYCKTGSQYGDSSSSKTKSSDIQSDIPQIQKQQYAESNLSSSVSSCHSNSYEGEWEQESVGTSETSSYNSDCNDDEEIALAISAAELASRNEARSRFRSSSDLIHRLFVCVSGVADQLQTNYAGDLRNILKSVFDIHSSEPYYPSDTRDKSSLINISAAHWRSREGERRSRNQRSHRSRTRINKEPPKWVPDDETSVCTACTVPFTFIRRRHHCRNCGKIFCGRCSYNFVPLPHYGQTKPVRVCNRCFLFQVTPFTVTE